MLPPSPSRPYDFPESGEYFNRRAFHDGVKHAGRSPGQHQSGVTRVDGELWIFWNRLKDHPASHYPNQWLRDDTDFLYSGQGQTGEMTLDTAPNRYLDERVGDESLPVHVAYHDTPGSDWRYLGQFIVADVIPRPDTPDVEGDLRLAYQFHLRALDASASKGPARPPDAEPPTVDQARLDDLYSDATSDEAEANRSSKTPRRGSRTEYFRDPKLGEYVVNRAIYFGGSCEGCGQTTFQDKSGRPFFQVHHTDMRSTGIPEHPSRMVAVCGTCHDRAHYAADGPTFNDGLTAAAATQEAKLGHPCA